MHKPVSKKADQLVPSHTQTEGLLCGTLWEHMIGLLLQPLLPISLRTLERSEMVSTSRHF